MTSYQETLRVLNYVCTPVISCRSATNTARTKLLLGEGFWNLRSVIAGDAGILGLTWAQLRVLARGGLSKGKNLKADI